MKDYAEQTKAAFTALTQVEAGGAVGAPSLVYAHVHRGLLIALDSDGTLTVLDGDDPLLTMSPAITLALWGFWRGVCWIEIVRALEARGV